MSAHNLRHSLRLGDGDGWRKPADGGQGPESHLRPDHSPLCPSRRRSLQSESVSDRAASSLKKAMVGYPPFRLCCRWRDWLAANDKEGLREVPPNRAVAVKAAALARIQDGHSPPNWSHDRCTFDTAWKISNATAAELDRAICARLDAQPADERKTSVTGPARRSQPTLGRGRADARLDPFQTNRGPAPQACHLTP